MSDHARAVAEAAEAARQLRTVADAAQADYMRAVIDALDAGCSMADLALAAKVTRTGLYQALRKHRARELARWEADRRPVAVPSREQLLTEYRLARHAQVIAQEARTGGYAADVEFERSHGVAQPVTFRQFLQGARTA